jgi:heme-degrading monooxygenase HmoA
MFTVIFEVQPRSDRWDAYLGLAGALRPELIAIDGFIDNVRYGSKRREGWVLSLSTWRDEKALVRWRTLAPHHAAQEQGRTEVFRDYHLRVGQVTADTNPPSGHAVREQRLDETETGTAKSISIVELRRPLDLAADASAETIARRLGLPSGAGALVDWDVFEAILTPGDLLLLLGWRDAEAGEFAIPSGARHRRVRVVRDYGMFQRHEAPQFYPEVKPL